MQHEHIFIVFRMGAPRSKTKMFSDSSGLPNRESDAIQTRCSGKPRLPLYARREADETSPVADVLSHAIVHAHPEQA